MARGPLLLCAGASSELGWAAMFKALEIGDLVVVATLSSLGPLFALMFSLLIGIERKGPTQMIGIILSIVGVVMLNLTSTLKIT